ncbi:MAG: heavy-metal-associated domain-containing protein [Bryobacterales bacterium]|nr:heavy-metal-associated domain-containing protein [Bryobacterales bacterium]
MAEHIHHVPGRLRVTSSKVKRNPASVAPLERSLQALAGVRSASVSAVTGSILVFYDSKVTSAEHLLKDLHARGYWPAHGETTTQPKHARYLGPATAAIGSFVARKAVEKAAEIAIERALIALITAIL